MRESGSIAIGFDANQRAIVNFKKGTVTAVEPVKWTVEGAGGAWTMREGFPSRSTRARSIHRSQDLTSEAVDVYLGQFFGCGLAYVAIFLASSQQGLRVRDIETSAVRADP